MGYRVETSGPARPALICLRTGAEGLPEVERTLGVFLPRPAGLVSRNASVTVFGLGPDEWLIRTGPDEEEDWLARLTEATAGSFSAVILVSDAWRVFTVTGPEALDVLAQATGVDLHPSAFPNGRAARAAFAGASALVHRLDDRPAFDIYVDASLVRYAGRWMEAAIGDDGESAARLSGRRSRVERSGEPHHHRSKGGASLHVTKFDSSIRSSGLRRSGRGRRGVIHGW